MAEGWSLRASMRSRDIRTSLYSKILPLQALIPFALAISPDRGTLAWGNGGEGGFEPRTLAGQRFSRPPP